MSPRQEIVYLAAVFMRLRMLRIQASLGTSPKPQAGGALAEMRKGLSGRECIFPLFPTPFPSSNDWSFSQSPTENSFR